MINLKQVFHNLVKYQLFVLTITTNVKKFRNVNLLLSSDCASEQIFEYFDMTQAIFCLKFCWTLCE